MPRLEDLATPIVFPVLIRLMSNNTLMVIQDADDLPLRTGIIVLEYNVPADKQATYEALASAGWEVTGEAPLSFIHSDGSIAKGQAAQMVMECVRKGWYTNGGKLL